MRIAGLRGVVAALCLMQLLHPAPADAQTVSDPNWRRSAPSIGGTAGTGPVVQPRMVSGSQNLEILRHRDYGGKPCLTIGGYGRLLTPTSKVFDHVLEARNACPKLIKVQLCYYKSQQCVDAQVPGNQRKEVTLGTGAKEFQFEFRERF